ncbi:hypothetical protein SCHPADRAFT_335166 [Schizopora paradoxa]|uniref:Uncharacterized protein n=1 Tax=Schizopora paradoxa TaxID=27342 RepID=A0A0H2SAX7_9AGAM|nr:hypothetical protein SCHPADRAFT_335166 [Schizopora paradoxa]
MPTGYPVEFKEEPFRQRGLDPGRTLDDMRMPPPIDEVRKAHSPGVPLISVPPTSDKGFESRLSDPEYGSRSGAPPVRLRRPKFSDPSDHLASRLAPPTSEERDLSIDVRGDTRPYPNRSNSLLERLNMASGNDPKSSPSLRERVEFPSHPRDINPAEMGDNYIADIGDGDGDSRRGPYKGRSRRERSRRPRGRGSFGNV